MISRISYKEVEALLTQAKQAATLKERNKLYAEATDLIWAEAPAVFLFDGINSLGAAKNLRGVYSDGAHSLWNVKYAWLDK